MLPSRDAAIRKATRDLQSTGLLLYVHALLLLLLLLIKTTIVMMTMMMIMMIITTIMMIPGLGRKSIWGIWKWKPVDGLPKQS